MKNLRGEKVFYSFFRFPEVSNRIFTYRTAEEFIPHGFRTATDVTTEIDPDALHFDGYYWNIGEIEFIDASWQTEDE